MATKISDLPAAHAEGCGRSLPYHSPLHAALDADCPRCRGLLELLDAAAERRTIAKEQLKQRIVLQLDTLPHGARGTTQGELIQFVDGPQPGKRIRLMQAINELMDDKIIQQFPSGGLIRYTLKGR